MSQPAPQGHLLIVEDEPEIIEVLVDVLSPLAASVATASNGKRALEHFRLNPVDAIISDIRMPEMTGLELVSEIRATGSQVPIVLLTAYGERENLIEAIRLHATDFLEKPFDVNSLIQIMTYALNLGVAQRELEGEFDRALDDSPLTGAEKMRILERRKMVLGLRSKKVATKKPL